MIKVFVKKKEIFPNAQRARFVYEILGLVFFANIGFWAQYKLYYTIHII